LGITLDPSSPQRFSTSCCFRRFPECFCEPESTSANPARTFLDFYELQRTPGAHFLTDFVLTALVERLLRFRFVISFAVFTSLNLFSLQRSTFALL